MSIFPIVRMYFSMHDMLIILYFPNAQYAHCMCAARCSISSLYLCVLLNAQYAHILLPQCSICSLYVCVLLNAQYAYYMYVCYCPKAQYAHFMCAAQCS